MGMPVKAGREYWQGVLVAGGSTVIPRWTLDPRPGVGECTIGGPGGRSRGNAGPAAEPGATLLAAHAVVLAALAGEREVMTGYVAGRVAGRCRAADHRARPVAGARARGGPGRAELLRPRGGPGRRSAARAGSGRAVVRDRVRPARRRRGRAVPLRVGIVDHGGGQSLRLRYRTDVLDADAAARIAGYHLAALRYRRRPRRRPPRQTCCPTEERRLPAGGARRARAGSCPIGASTSCSRSGFGAHPDAVAAVHGAREWTYAELNARANRIARALLARGLRRGGRGGGGHRAQPGLDGRGDRRSSRPAGCTCRSSRTSRPTGSRAR